MVAGSSETYQAMRSPLIWSSVAMPPKMTSLVAVLDLRRKGQDEDEEERRRHDLPRRPRTPALPGPSETSIIGPGKAGVLVAIFIAKLISLAWWSCR